MRLSPSSEYSEEEMIPLSGIQHYLFCPRQWALIHIEQAWADNALTAEGSLQHKNVDNPSIRETNGSDIITLRGLHISSSKLGLCGVTDAVEIIPNDGAPKKKEELIKSKLFTLLPVEYKHGKSKTNDCDRIQVTAQALLLEEMFNVKIKQAAIFYWQTRRREYFTLTTKLREDVVTYAYEMHHLFKEGLTPPAMKKDKCKSCSLIDFCMPSLCNHNISVYFKSYLNEETS